MVTDLTLRPFLWRARELYPEKRVVTRTPEGRHSYTYGEYADRVAQLANALEAWGVAEGDAVGTFCWNTHRHFETYFAVPDVGAKLHTLNVNLPDGHLEHMLADAGDRLVFVSPDLLDQFERLQGSGALDPVEQFVVTGGVPDTDLDAVGYEEFISGHDTDYTGPPLSEDQPAAMCYTSGTTGLPKGVEYTHKMLWTQALASVSPAGYGFDESDTILQSVPMFHINGWLWPYQAAMLGADLVLPGPDPSPAVLADLIEREGVTFTGMVPTVWLNLIEHVEREGTDVSSLETAFTGGAAPPDRILRWFESEGLEVVTGSGMTEVTALGTTGRLKSTFDEAQRRETLGKAGHPLPGLVFRVVDDDGEEVPWDGETVGELQYQGPFVVDEYYERPEANAESFQDGWLKTGDIVTVDGEGYIDIVDRTDHLIKSGGEWISSTEVENALLDHEAVVEAAVVARPDERWGERPVAYLSLSAGEVDEAMESELLDLVGREHPTWWAPDEFVVLDSLPKTATGKLDKKALEDRL
ncbi:MAG: long-chain-fatty-acid--CoA ligase [Haloarculaceae archaeon]